MLKPLVFIAAILTLGISASAQNPNPSATLDAFILSEMQAEKIPGMTTIIVKNGEVVWRKAYGIADVPNNVPTTDSTIFLLASVSKLFTGTALMQLATNGQIDFDADINLHLPFAVRNPNHPNTPITARMLMTHTSSIIDNDNVMDNYYSIGDPTMTLAEVIERYFSITGADYSAENNFMTSTPGQAYEYSNIASALAGYLVERVTQMPFNEYCQQHIFSRLCMNSTSWFLAGLDLSQVARPHEWAGGQYTALPHMGFADYPNGLLRSNVLDLANFMMAFLQGGMFSGNTILPQTAVDQMLTVQFPSINNTQGLNWYREAVYLDNGNTVQMWGHNGGEAGTSTELYIRPQNGIGVAVLSNAEGDNMYVIDALYNYALTLNSTGAGNAPCFVSVNEVDNQPNQPIIYPNPTTGRVWLKQQFSPVSTTIARVFSSTGTLVSQNMLSADNSIDLSGLPVGLYHIQLVDGGQILRQERAVLCH